MKENRVAEKEGWATCCSLACAVHPGARQRALRAPGAPGESTPLAESQLPFSFQVSQRKGAEAEKRPTERNCKIRSNNRFSYFKIPAFYKFENTFISLF